MDVNDGVNSLQWIFRVEGYNTSAVKINFELTKRNTLKPNPG
jgi:hypothetical protein